MKIILLSLIVVAILLLPACADSKNVNSAGMSGSQETISTSGISSCEKLHAYYTIEDYNAYLLSQNKLPSSFVHWDDISVLGDFLGFIPPRNPQNSTEYKYIFSDTNGKDISLQITHINTSNRISTQEYPLVSATADMTSMQHAPVTERSIIIRNGVQYHYNSGGSLYTIVWFDTGIMFQIAGLTTDYNTPFYNRMVSISETEAAAAFAEIKQSLDAS